MPYVPFDDRRASPRVTFRDSVELTFNPPLRGESVDVSTRGVRVRLPAPLPDSREMGFRLRLGHRWVEGQARVGRTSADRQEAVLLFDGDQREIEAFVTARTAEVFIVGETTPAPFGDSRALHAMRDEAGLMAALAHCAARRADVAQVYRASEDGWSLVVESDGERLRWGKQARGLLGTPAKLLVVPVIASQYDNPLLLMVRAHPTPGVQDMLEELAAEASCAWNALLQQRAERRRFLGWRAMQKHARQRILDGLEHESTTARAQSMKALLRCGVDVLDYSPDLSPTTLTIKRRQIEELVAFREWYAERLAD